MHVSGSEENFKYQIHCTCSKVIVKNIGNLIVRLLVFSLLTFRYFSTIVSLSGAGAGVFYASDSGSGSEQTVSAAPTPAPAPTNMCRLRWLRLRIPG